MIIIVMAILVIILVTLAIICGIRGIGDNLPSFIFGCIAVFPGIAFIIMMFAMIDTQIKEEAYIKANETLRASLVYQLENETYKDDIIGTQQLYNKITNFNVNLAKIKVKHDNIWIGCFYADYSSIEPIKLEESR